MNRLMEFLEAFWPDLAFLAFLIALGFILPHLPMFVVIEKTGGR